MVHTINPAGCGIGGWLVGTGMFSLATLLSTCMVLFVSVWIASALPLRGIVISGCCLLGLCLARDLGAPVPVPYRSQQVPEGWRSRYAISVSSAAYGFQLGTGFATPFSSAAHMAMVVGVAATRSPGIALAAAGLFTLPKSLSLLATAKATSHEAVLACTPLRERSDIRRIVARRAAGAIASMAVVAALLGLSSHT
jgi:hypothetical protein